jgi:hypothetical protein
VICEAVYYWAVQQADSLVWGQAPYELYWQVRKVIRVFPLVGIGAYRDHIEDHLVGEVCL